MNLYKQLLDILPSDPLLVGEVTAHNADGTSTVELPDGALLYPRGQGVSIGSNAFVRRGLVEGEAPSLAVELIDV